MTSGMISFATVGIPYRLDAWTRELTPILLYTQTTTHTFISFELAPLKATMIVFAAQPIVDVPYSSQNFLSSPVGVVGFTYNSTSGLGAYLTSSTPALQHHHL